MNTLGIFAHGFDPIHLAQSERLRKGYPRGESATLTERDQHQAAWSRGSSRVRRRIARAKRWWLRRHTLDELRSVAAIF